MRAARAALVGIDGAGKSTLIEGVRRRSIAADDVVTLSALAAHEVPGAPLHRLSRHLTMASQLADELGSPPLKAAVLYLHMTLFAPAERYLLRTRRPRWVLSDRHPVIDTLVYGDLYRRLLAERQRMHAGGWEATIRYRLERDCRGAYPAMISWLRSLGPQAGGADNLEQLVESISAAFALPAARRIAQLQERYATGLPDVVFFIDVDPAAAGERSAARPGGRNELHEQAAHLEQLRAGYQETLRLLRRMHPELTVHRILNRPHAAAAAIDELLARLLPIRGSRREDTSPDGRWPAAVRNTSVGR